MPVGRVVTIAVASTLFLVCLVGLAWRARQRSLREHAQRERLLQESIDAHTQSKIEINVLQEAWRIPPADLVILEFLAVGGQGRVYRGLWRRLDVAVKFFPRDVNYKKAWGFSNAARIPLRNT